MEVHLPTRMTRRAARRMNTNPVRLGVAIAAATTAGVMATAGTAGAQAPAVPQSLLHQGSRGSAVSRVQRALHVRRSGRFGPATTSAVVAFQRRDGLLVDGIVGPQTWDALFHITPPAGATSPSTTSSTGAADPASSGAGDYSIPSGIVQCESGGDYSAVNPSTGAGGAYQILPSTWQAYGGQGLPQDASPAEQNQIAGEIYASQGPSAWTC